MSRPSAVASLALIGSLSACATIVSGSSQRLTVNTVPEGASCRVSQGGLPIATIPATPGTILVGKSSSAVQVSCAKPGFQIAERTQPSGVDGWIFGNIVIGGLIGVVIDLTSGAAYHYDPTMLLAMQGRLGGPQAYGSVASGYDPGYVPPPGYAADAAFQPDQDGLENRRVRAAEARASYPGRGTIVLPPSTPNGDVTYVWPRSDTD